jgi:Ca-activated chloride channel family protein
MLIILALSACAPQDASRSRSEYVAEEGATAAAQRYATEADLLKGIMPADELRVEEYLNYYDQSFSPPPAGSALGLDASLGSTHVPDSGGEVWLQVGLQATETVPEDIRPLNLVLVLDKSGSMADADKMSYLKDSLLILLDELHEEDIIAIVVYDDYAEVLLPAQTIGDGEAIRAAIDGLRPGGATNLHGGLMLGYEEASRFYDPDLNNRIILLTDGIANRGETVPERIARDSLEYNQQGIFLSTIGLGFEFNDELLSTLAEQGKGNYHFVGDAEDMEKVFRDEVAGLVQTVATDVWLTLNLAEGAQIQRVYGYDYELEGNTMLVQFDDAGAESNQILMVKLILPAGDGAEQTLARATLTYADVFTESGGEQEHILSFSYGAPEPYDPIVSPSVRRNVTIIKMAEVLQQVSYYCDQGMYQEALDIVQGVKAEVWEIATQEDDAQMQEDVEILTNYETILQKLIDVSSAPPPPVSAPPDYSSQPRPCLAPAAFLGLVFLALGVVGASKPQGDL